MTGNVMARHDSGAPEDPERSLLMAYVIESTLSIYRQRVADGKIVPIDRLTELAVRLVCYGALYRRRGQCRTACSAYCPALL